MLSNRLSAGQVEMGVERHLLFECLRFLRGRNDEGSMLLIIS